MKAIVVDQEADDHPLRWESVPNPVPGPGEVLVDIHATAVNRADLLQRAGFYPPPPGSPEYLGLEMAGVVFGTGETSGGWQPGDRVCGLLAGGGYAEQVSVPHQLLLRLPANWDFAKGAAVMEVFLTAYVNLFMEARLEPGETVLVHGGASGVGTAAIQMAREWGCRIAATASNNAKLDRCVQLGAHLAVNYKEQDFADAILAEGVGVDVILDIGGAEYLEPNLRVLNLMGRLVIVALLTGAAGTIDLGIVQRKRIRIIGSVLRRRSLEEKSEIVHGFTREFWPLLEQGRMEPVIDTILPITDVEEAHAILTKNQNIGKVVLTVR